MQTKFGPLDPPTLHNGKVPVYQGKLLNAFKFDPGRGAIISVPLGADRRNPGVSRYRHGEMDRLRREDGRRGKQSDCEKHA
jgi:hypothetical protein